MTDKLKSKFTVEQLTNYANYFDQERIFNWQPPPQLVVSLAAELLTAWKQNEELVKALEWYATMKKNTEWSKDANGASFIKYELDQSGRVAREALAKFRGENIPDEPIKKLVELAKTTPPKNEHGT